MPHPATSTERAAFLDEEQHKATRHFWKTYRLPSKIIWGAIVVLLVSKYSWARSWLLSGTPLLCYILIGRFSRSQETSSISFLWASLATVNLAYAVASTSWLLFGAFISICWPATVIASLYHFPFTANSARRFLRAILSQLHFVNDQIAFFDLPALEIDTEVSGLMVIRGLTIYLSTLKIEAHSVEVGIKLTDDIELAIQVQLVEVFLFRRIEISDVYANLKGGVHEMTFGEIQESTENARDDPMLDMDTEIIKCAAAKAEEAMGPEKAEIMRQIKIQSAKDAKHSIKRVSPRDQDAVEKYNRIMDEIQTTNSIIMIGKRIQRSRTDLKHLTDKGRRAAICSLLHDGPSIPHPPHHSIKVTTLQNLPKPSVRRTLHRLPLLLRLLLNPLSYFHPVQFKSVTAAASGPWIKHMLMDSVFKEYADDSADLKGIRNRIMSWLSDANFTVQLDDIRAMAQVPIITEYNISCLLRIKDITISRTFPKKVDLHEVACFGGADAAFSIPTYLLPHHEHLLPPTPTKATKNDLETLIADADGKPQQRKAERDLEQAEKDETNVNVAVHAQLPAWFDQTLLDFIAALVKATKMIEMTKDPDPMDAEVHGIKDFARSLNSATRNSIKMAAVGGIVNDKWIAKLVGKITKALETAHGDVGYSGDIPLPLKPYRDAGMGEASKILP